MIRKLFERFAPLYKRNPAKARGNAQEKPGAPDMLDPDRMLSESLEENLKDFSDRMALCSDFVLKRLEFRLEDGGTAQAGLFYIDGLADKELIQQFVLRPLLDYVASSTEIRELETRVLSASGTRLEASADKLMEALLYSSTILLVEGQKEGIIISSEGWEHRQVGEAMTEPIIRGPQDAFNEVLRTNTALVRRRLKDPHLAVEQMKLGRRSRTDTAVLYLKDVAHPGLVKEVKRRLEAIDTDSVMDGGEIEEYLEDNPMSPFPQIMSSERVDKTVASLLEGKVAVILDGSPYALSMPATFSAFLFSPEDYYSKFTAATFIRWIRALSLILALFLPSVYIALTTFHQEMLPTQLMLSSAANRTGVPFPAFVEALLMEISIELLREASLRLPGTMGQTIGIVGALVIGQAAVEAGIVGPVLTIIVSFTAIGSFVIPSYTTSIAIRLLRFPIMALAATLGIFGIVFGGAAILIHLVNLRPFGVGYMEPFRPSRWEHMDDSIFIKKPSYMLKFRQRFLKTREVRRRS